MCVAVSRDFTGTGTVAHTVPVPVYAGLIDSSCRDVPSLIDGPAGIAVRRLACIDTTARFWTRRQHSR